MMNPLILLLGASIMVTFPAQAADLASALASRKVCEMASGYIQATSGNENEMSGLVADVNAKRERIYSDIAAKDGIEPAAVGIENARQEKAVNPGKFCQ
jgi:uncharacterized protein YdbL (DUF1318 family)